MSSYNTSNDHATPTLAARSLLAAAARSSRSSSPALLMLPQSECDVPTFTPHAAATAAQQAAASDGFPPLHSPLHSPRRRASLGMQHYETSPTIVGMHAGGGHHHAHSHGLAFDSETPNRTPRPEPALPHSALDIDAHLSSPPLSRPGSASIDALGALARRNSTRRVSLSVADLGLMPGQGLQGVEVVSVLDDDSGVGLESLEGISGLTLSGITSDDGFGVSMLGLGNMAGSRASGLQSHHGSASNLVSMGGLGFDDSELHSLASLDHTNVLLSSGGISMISADHNSRVDLSPTSFAHPTSNVSASLTPIMRSPVQLRPSSAQAPSPTHFSVSGALAMPNVAPSPVLIPPTSVNSLGPASLSLHAPILHAAAAANNGPPHSHPTPVLLRTSNDERDLLRAYPLLVCDDADGNDADEDALPPPSTPAKLWSPPKPLAASLMHASSSGTSRSSSSSTGSLSSPTAPPAVAPILSPSSMQRRQDAQMLLKRNSISSPMSTGPLKPAQNVLEEDVGDLFSTAVSWAADGGRPTLEVCDTHLAQSLVVCIGDVAHATPNSGGTIPLQRSMAHAWQAMSEVADASDRERRRQEARDQAQDPGQRRSSLAPSVASSAAAAFAMGSSLTRRPSSASSTPHRSRSFDQDRGEHRSPSPSASSSHSPVPPDADEDEQLPTKAKLALQQALNLLSQVGEHPELTQPLLDVLHMLLQHQAPISLANGLSLPNSDVEECWRPIWQWLHELTLEEERDVPTRSQAMDVLFMLALARGSVFILYHVLDTLLEPTAAALSLPCTSLEALVRYTRSVATLPVDERETRSLNLQLSSNRKLSAATSAIIIATQMATLTFSSCPLSDEYLSDFNLSPCNPNNQGVSYRALCIDTAGASVRCLFDLFVTVHERLKRLKETIEIGKAADDSEHELANNIAVAASLLRIMQVHLHQLVLQNPQPTEDDLAEFQVCLPPFQSLLALHASSSPHLSALGSAVARCLAFGASFFWPSVSSQVVEVTRLLTAAAAAWRDPAHVFVTHSSLTLARLLLKRLSGFSIAAIISDVLYQQEVVHARALDLTQAQAEKFVSSLVAAIEAAAMVSMTPASTPLTRLQSELLQCAVATLECLQQQIVCAEMALVQSEEHASQSQKLAAAAAKEDPAPSRKQTERDEEEKKGSDEHSDVIASPVASALHYPPMMPTLPSHLSPPHYFLRYAPLLLSSMNHLASHATQVSTSKDAGECSLFLQALRTLAQPLILISCKLCSPLRPEFSLAILPSLTALVEQMARLAPMLPNWINSRCDSTAATNTVVLKQVFESTHPYRPFCDNEIVLSLPNPAHAPPDAPAEWFTHPPLEVSVTFEPQCATHSKYDYVELFGLLPTLRDARGISEAFSTADKKATNVLRSASLSERFSGSHIHRNGSWPTEPLVFKNQHVLLHFCTVATTRPAVAAEENSSYYGFRVQVECTYSVGSRSPRSLARVPRWYSRTMQASAWLAASSAAALIKALPPGEDETKSYQWLRSYLFSGGLERHVLTTSSKTPKALPGVSSSPPSTGSSAPVSQAHSRTASLTGAPPFHSIAHVVDSSTSSVGAAVNNPDDMTQAFLNHLCMSDAQRQASTHFAANYAENLLTRLVASGVDRQIIQKSVSAVANQLTAALFAVMVKHYGRTGEAMAAGASDADTSSLDPTLTRLWKKAAEIKMDVRTQQSVNQDVRGLRDTLMQRIAFLHSLAAPGVDLDARDGGMVGLNVPDLLRRQHSSGSIGGRDLGSRHRGESDSLPSIRPGLSKQHSLWTKNRIMSKLLRNTMRSMKELKSLMRIRTRTSDEAGEEDALARSILSFLRKGDAETTFVALHAQHLRATQRLTGLQAVHRLAKRLLGMRMEGSGELRPGDSGPELAELCLSQVSRALRAPIGSVVPPDVSGLASASVGHTTVDASVPATSSSSAPAAPMHVLSNVDCIGLEMRSFIFNEYYAFLGSFLELTSSGSTAAAGDNLGASSSVLSSAAQLHLLHLCAANFEWEKTAPLIPVGPGMVSLVGDVPRPASLTRSHDMFALSRLGILKFLRPLTALFKPTPTSAPSSIPNSLTSSLTSSLESDAPWSLDAAALRPHAPPSSDLPWSVGYAAWALFRLLAYASAPASPGWSDVDAGALEISEGVLAELRGQLEANVQREDELARSEDSTRVPLSLADASIAWHLHSLHAGKSVAAPASTSFALRAPSSPTSAFSPRSISRPTLPAGLAGPIHGRSELLAHRSQLLWVLARCAQSASFAGRMAASDGWVRLLLKLASPLAPSSSIDAAEQADEGLMASRLLALQIARNILPLVSPKSNAFDLSAASTANFELAEHATLDGAKIMEQDDSTYRFPSPSSPFGAPVPAVLPAASFLSTVFERVGQSCIASCTGAGVSPHSLSEADHYVWLARTLLACPTAGSQPASPADLTAEVAFSPMSPTFTPLPTPTPSQHLPHHTSGNLKQTQADWQDLLHSFLCTHLRRLTDLDAHSLRDPRNLPDVGKLLAALWILGGGQASLGEGAKVKLELKGQQRTGLIIRTVNSTPDQEREDATGQQIAVSGLVDEDVLYEVVLDPSSRVNTESVLHSEPAANGNAASPHTQTIPTAIASPVTAAPGLHTRDVYLLYASSLIPSDTVAPPVKHLTVSAAQSIIHSLGTLLKTIENEQDIDASHSLLHQWQQQEQRAAGASLSTPIKSTASSSRDSPATLTSSGARLLWADLKQRSLKVVHSLLEREDLAALMLRQGLGPLLVPIALQEIVLDQCAMVAQPPVATTPSDSSATSGPGLAAGSAGSAPAVTDCPSLDTEEQLSVHLSITELELRTTALSRCIAMRRAESALATMQRHRAWATLDAKLLAEKRLHAKALDDRRKSELARLPPLTLAYASHSHPLHYFTVVYDGLYNCDNCSHTRSGAVYHCTPCKYDLCMSCAAPVIAAANAATQSAAAANPPAAAAAAPVTVDPVLSESVVLQPTPPSTPSRSSVLSAGRASRITSGSTEVTPTPPSATHTTSSEAAAVASLVTQPSPPTKSTLQQQLMLLGLTEAAANHAALHADALTAVLDSFDESFYAPRLDQPAVGMGGSASDSWSLFPGGYAVTTPRLPEGWPRIRAFMLAYTEASVASEGDVDSYGRRTGIVAGSAASALAPIDSPKKDKKERAKLGKDARTRKNHKDCNYNYMRAEHDPTTHRQDYGRWKELLVASVARHEADSLHLTAEAHARALGVLYARRSVLALLHRLEDQLAASPAPSNQNRRLSVATLAAHSAATKIGIPTTRVLHHSADSDALPAESAFPPFLRRTASVAHALSSFGPAGFMGELITLLCSAPHQLATSLGGDGRRSSLSKLGGVVGTILLAEKHCVATEWSEGRPMSAAVFKMHAPIARHLLQGACTHMLALCKHSRIDSGARHALIHTVEYIFDAFFSLEDHVSPSAQAQSPRAPSDDVSSSRTSSDGGSMMLLSLFTMPVCLLMLEVISASCFALSPSGSHCIASGAAGVVDETAANPLAAVLERQRLFFVRLLSRVITVRTRIVHSSPGVVRSLHTAEVSRQWSALFHQRCNALRYLVLGALDDETLGGRGSLALTSFPLSFFLQALVDLALVWNRYISEWDSLEIMLPIPEPLPVAALPPPPAASSPTPPSAISFDLPLQLSAALRDSSSPLAAASPLGLSPPTTMAPAPSPSSSSDIADGRASHPSSAPDRRSLEAQRFEKRNEIFRRLVVLDHTLTFLRSRPRGAQAVKSGLAPSPAPSPAASPSSSPMPTPQSSPTAAAAIASLNVSTSHHEGTITSDTLVVPVGAALLSTPRRLSRSDIHSADGLLSPSPTASGDSPTTISVIAPSFDAAIRRSEKGVPLEFVNLFWEKTQRSLLEAEKKERATLRRKLRRAEADKLLAAERELELRPAVTSSSSEWECPVCTYCNGASLTSCEMCSTMRAEVKQLNNDTQIYFEVTILDAGQDGSIGIGLVCHDYPTDQMPGWEEGGYGYHGDDGCAFAPPIQGAPYGPKYTTGDTIGCGYYPFKRQIFFTKNGAYLGVAFTDVPPLDFHAAVGMHSEGESVRLNVGHQPFLYKEVSAKLIKRPDLHWGRPLPECELTEASLEATWGSSDCGLLISNAPLISASKPAPVHSDEICYFEVTMPSPGATPEPLCMAVGFALSVYGLDRMPGWDEESFALHGDNASLYSGAGEFLRRFGSTFHAGDVVGCGFDRKKHEIFFTQQGKHVGVAFAHVPECAYHAAIGLYNPGEIVRANFGAEPFAYDVLNQARAAATTAAASTASARPPMALLSPVANTFSIRAPSITLSSNSLTATMSGDEADIVVVLSALPVVSADLDGDATDEVEAVATSLPIEAWQSIEACFGPAEDEELVALLNRRAEKTSGGVNSAAASSGADPNASPLSIDAASFQLTDEERVTHSILNNIVESTSSSGDALVVGGSLNLTSTFVFVLRVAFLQQLNQLLASVTTLVNLSRTARRSLLSRHYRDGHVRALFFCGVKKYIVRQSLTQTAATQDQTKPLFKLKLDLFKSQRLAQQTRVDVGGTKTIFGQAFQKLHLHRHEEENKYGDHDRDPTRLLVKYRQRAWNTVFEGMFSHDFGGPYRDVLDRMCHEVQSTLLPLFILCPNAREQIGQNRNHVVPNPSAASPVELSMFEFLGRLIGLAMRSGDLLTLDLPSIVWKPLVDDPVTEEDVMAIDRLSFKMLHELRKLESTVSNTGSGITPDEFGEYIDSSFVVVGSDMKPHELVPGGEHIPVTWGNRDEFASSLLWYRKHEFRVQTSAIRHGLSQVVPISMLSLLTWQELRNLVCGSGVIDLTLLRKLTLYEGCSDRDPHIQHFWKVMATKFDDQERAAFIQFVWGRSRLPSTAAEFERKFTIQLLHPRSGRPNDYLPVAHTCFMSLELPSYSSLEIMHRKLLYAISNCVAIDADSTEQAQQAGRMTGALDSEDDEEGSV